MNTVLISCGGTGGHLSPGIALAEALAGRGYEPLLLVSHKRVDQRLAAKYAHLSFQCIPGAPLAMNPLGWLRFGWHQGRAYLFSRRLIRRSRPRAVVGFGGFTSASIILAARAAGTPVALHEANRVPGRAIRVLGRWAQRVYLPAGIQVAGLRIRTVKPAGFPVRREIQRQPREAACAGLGLDPRLKVLVVLGGSQGASALNDWARSQAAPLAHAGIQVVCVTGLGKGEPEHLEHPDAQGSPVRARFIPFSDQMAELLSAADLVVSRAGAGSLAELARCGTPAVLVPFPHAADNHQAANAAHFAASGAGRVVDQTAIASLMAEVQALILDEEALAGFRANLQRLDRDNSLAAIVEDLESLMLPAGSKRTGAGSVEALATRE